MAKMRKEVVIGLTVITLLLGIFGAMLYKRLRTSQDDASAADVMTAGKLPVPIDSHEPKATLVPAGSLADEGAVAPSDWAAPRSERAALASAEQNDLPPRESYLPREQFTPEQAALETAADESAVLAPEEQPIGDPFAARREAAPPASSQSFDPQTADPRSFDPSVPDTASTPTAFADSPPAEFESQLRARAEREQRDDALPQSDDPGLVRGQRADELAVEREAAEGIPTSGAMPQDEDSPRSGFRSRFPQRDEPSGGNYGGYEAPERQPGHLHHESAEVAGAAHARVSVENGKYTVAPNDNYWIISQKVYGDGGYFKAIYEHNRLRFPRSDKLQVGDVLDVPHTSVLQERYADLCPKQRKVPSARNTLLSASTRHRAGERIYVVSEGDTLFDIAKYELGKATRWAEIYELNRDVLGEEFDYLRPGTELVLPHDRREQESVTRGRDPGMQR